MTDYPLLPLPRPEIREPPQGRGFPPPQPRLPSQERQTERIGPVFDRLAGVLDEGRDPVRLGDDPAGLAPDRAIVFEVAGSIRDFAAACGKVSGLEYLIERDETFEPNQDFWMIDTRQGKQGRRRRDKRVEGRVYAAMPDVRALRELVRLWQLYRDGLEPDRGFKQWPEVFKHLYDLRPWGPQERVTDDAILDFRMDLEEDSASVVTVEVELWHRKTQLLRDEAMRQLVLAVDQAGGSVVHRASIPPIAYHAALVRLPRREVERLVAREFVHLVVCDQVMFVRPQCSRAQEPTSRELDAGDGSEDPLPSLDEPPVAALLDGIPVQRHRLLDGRVIVDDPDDLDSRSLVTGRRHGTAMASVIIHGDRGRPEVPLGRPLHVHPVMYSSKEDGSHEQFHPDRLIVDTIYRAVVRMKEGEGDSDATAPSVFIVNLSLGDRKRPYAGWISPWARLLDYLAQQYDMLFVVSAGNIGSALPIPRFGTVVEFESATASEREEAVLDGLGRHRSQRTLLSPSEAINVVTVGACHDDAIGAEVPAGVLLDPYVSTDLPNISSALGLGHRKTVKPEILMPGGQELVRALPDARGVKLEPSQADFRFGVKAASPDGQGSLDRERPQSGTSVAAALATRAAHQVFDALMDEENGGLLAEVDPIYRAVVVRALLIHGARWNEAIATKLGTLYGPWGPGKHVERLDNVARVIGYGTPRVEQVMACTASRATLIGYGQMENRQSAVCRVPLPPSLSRVTALDLPRFVTVTLAWFSPVNVKRQAYRMAKLEVAAQLEEGFGVGRTKSQPSYSSIPRGTLFHQRYDGERAVEFVEDGFLTLSITCKEQAGPLDKDVRYGLAVTIESKEGVPVYQEIRDRLRVRPRP